MGRILLEDVFYDKQLLRLVAQICALTDVVCRLAHCKLHFNGVVQDAVCQVQYVARHCGAEHDGLPVFGQSFCNLQDIVAEAHVEHAVGFVQDEERDTAEVNVPQAQMTDESARCGNDNVGAALHGAFLLLVADAVVAAVDSHAAHVVQIVGESLHGTVYLLRKLAGRGHDDAVDGIVRESAVGQLAQHRQQVGRSLPCARLRNAHHIPALQDRRDSMLLNRSRVGKVHVVECIEDFIIEV